MVSYLLALLLLLFSAFATSQEIISQTVAEISNEYITSREVLLSALISICSLEKCEDKSLINLRISSDQFSSLLSKAIFERLAYKESVGIFNETSSLPIKQMNKILSTKTSLKYKFTKNEVVEYYKIKSLSKNYIKFKDKNLSVYISDKEALNYYNLNKNKYNGLSYQKASEKVKSYLKKIRKRKRVEDWVSSMQTKYRVRQLIN